jgi:hypothetical protein
MRKGRRGLSNPSIVLLNRFGFCRRIHQRRVSKAPQMRTVDHPTPMTIVARGSPKCGSPGIAGGGIVSWVVTEVSPQHCEEQGWPAVYLAKVELPFERLWQSLPVELVFVPDRETECLPRSGFVLLSLRLVDHWDCYHRHIQRGLLPGWAWEQVPWYSSHYSAEEVAAKTVAVPLALSKR